MGTVIYLVGPSSVGKSTAAAAACTEVSAQVVDVDAALGRLHRPWRLESVDSALEQAQQSTAGLVIVDIGAGGQGDVTSHLADFLTRQSARAVLVIASPRECWLRNEELHQFGRSFKEYMRVEYWSRVDSG